MDNPHNSIEQERRQRYLVRAMELYGSQPFETVNNTLVAQRLGLSESEFDALFPSLSDLYFEGVKMIKGELLSIMTFPEDKNFEQGLGIVIRDFMTYVAERNLEADSSSTPIEHPLVDQYFSQFKNGKYILQLS